MYSTPRRMVASVLVAATLSLVVAQASSSASSAGSSTEFPPPQAPPPGVLDLVSHSSPNFELFPGVMSVSWRYMPNLETPNASIFAFRLSVTEGFYAGVGAAQYPPMGGPIVVCYVPPSAPENATCINYLGQPGGGLGPAPQANKLLWSSIENGTATVEFEVTVSTMQIANPDTDYTSLISAHGSWGEGYGPSYHGYDENATTMYVNLATSRVQGDQGFATVQAPPIQVFPQYLFTWSIWYGDLPYFQGTMVIPQGDVYGAVGFADQGMQGHIVACYYGSGGSDTTCVDLEGYDYGVKKSALQWTVVQAVSASGQYAEITFLTPLSVLNISSIVERRVIFATSTWNTTTGLPNPHDARGHTTRNINFFTNFVGTPSSPLYVVFDEALAFQWKVEFAAPGDVLEVTLCVALGFYGGIGFANAGMEGPITACFVNQSDATDVVCRDVIGQKGGGVEPNPVQYNRVLSSTLNPENTTVTLRIPIASLNLSYDPRTQDARLIFAYGYWNASAALPTFHGPNSTHARVGLYDGRWRSTPFPTELPFIPTPAPTQTPEILGK